MKSTKDVAATPAEVGTLLAICREAGVAEEDMRADDEHGLMISSSGYQKLEAWKPDPARRRAVDTFVVGAYRRRIRVVAGTDMREPSGDFPNV